MKTKTFEIPVDQVVEFADVLIELGLENEITGTDGDDKITIEISYDLGQRKEAFELMEWVEDNVDAGEKD